MGRKLAGVSPLPPHDKVMTGETSQLSEPMTTVTGTDLNNVTVSLTTLPGGDHNRILQVYQHKYYELLLSML